MSKWQSKDIPIFLTMLALFISTFSDKIEEWTSISSKFVQFFALALMLIPLYIYISGWLKHRNNK